MLVLAPGGFVARTGTAPGSVFSASYASVTAIALSIQHARYETITNLLLTFRHLMPDSAETPHLVQTIWRVDPRFGQADTIAQAILEAHARAMAMRSASDWHEHGGICQLFDEK